VEGGVRAPHVAIVGGGLAGLAAAVACADAGARVSLFESRVRLGGATWSTQHRGLEIDNGQHVFLRCCTAYRAFLARIGAADRVTLQPRLAIPVGAPDGRVAWIRRHPFPVPAHLAPTLLRFPWLPLAGRVRAGLTARRLAALDLADPALDTQRFGDWLAAQGESDAAIDGFWDLFVRPTVNLPAREASLALATKVFQTGLLTEPDGADLGYANVPLQRVHADPATVVLEKAGAKIALRAKVQQLQIGESDAIVCVDGTRVAADAVILATPPGDAAGLLPPEAGIDAASLAGLGAAPIANLHVVFERRVMDRPFLAGIGTPLQWIFDRSEASGLASGQYLAVSLSAADAWVGRSAEELRAVFLPAFEALLPGARGVPVRDCFVTVEREATFRGVPGTARLRPPARTRLPRLAVAGAWTQTGWPATMEGAVRSGAAAARAVLVAAGVTRSLPGEPA
jgi:squalene-associated FAD-dependent desaturase